MSDTTKTPFLEVSRISAPSSPLEEVIDLWVHGKSPHTQRYYRREVQKFLLCLGKPLDLVTLADVQAYTALSRDKCKNRQFGLKTFALPRFDNLLH